MDDKLDFKRILPIWIVILVDILGLTVIIPLLPLYAIKFQAESVMIGVLAASYPLCQFIAAPILGRLSDRYGRKPVLIVSQIGTLIGFLLLGWANSFWLLLLSRVIDGVSGGNIATAQAMITDSTSEKTRTQGLGLIGAAFGLGFIIGPLIAFSALALSGNNYHIPAFIAAGCSFCSILLTVFLLKETQHPDHRNEDAKLFNLFAVLRALTLPQIGLLLLLKFAEQFAFGGFESIVPLFQTSRLGLNASGNSLVFVFIGILVTIIQGGLIGLLSRRFSERQLILSGLLILAIGLVMIAMTPQQTVPWYSKAQLQEELHARTATTSITSIIIPEETNKGWAGFIWILVTMIPCAFGASIMQPSINSLLTKNATPQQRGEVLGYSSSYFSLANVFAPLFGFTLLQYFGMNAPLLVWAALLAALFLWAFVILKNPTKTS